MSVPVVVPGELHEGTERPMLWECDRRIGEGDDAARHDRAVERVVGASDRVPVGDPGRDAEQTIGRVRQVDRDVVPPHRPERRPPLAPTKLVASTDQVPVSEDPTCVSVILTRAVAGPEMLLWSVPVQRPLRNSSEGELGELSHWAATRQRPIRTAARTQIRRGRVIVDDRRVLDLLRAERACFHRRP